MTDWVQNIIKISAENFLDPPSQRDQEFLLLRKNIQNPEWWIAQGFRPENELGGYFQITKMDDGSLCVYVDSSWGPPIEEVFKPWAKAGLCFVVYYYDIYNSEFCGCWNSDSTEYHIELDPKEMAKDLDRMREIIPKEIDDLFGIVSQIGVDFNGQK